MNIEPGYQFIMTTYGIQEIKTPVERLELLGTKNYTTPECLLGMAGNDKSDLFSLGVICL